MPSLYNYVWTLNEHKLVFRLFMQSHKAPLYIDSNSLELLHIFSFELVFFFSLYVAHRVTRYGWTGGPTGRFPGCMCCLRLFTHYKFAPFDLSHNNNRHPPYSALLAFRFLITRRLLLSCQECFVMLVTRMPLGTMK